MVPDIAHEGSNRHRNREPGRGTLATPDTRV